MPTTSSPELLALDLLKPGPIGADVGLAMTYRR